LESTLEVLKVALDFEQKGMEFYREAAGRVKGKVMASVLFSLAEDEEAHQMLIRRFYHAIEGGQTAPTDGIDMTPPKAAAERIEDIMRDTVSTIGADATYQSIYETAVELEIKSYEYYTSQASYSPKTAKFFTFLAEIEAIHRQMLEMMLGPMCRAPVGPDHKENPPQASLIMGVSCSPLTRRVGVGLRLWTRFCTRTSRKPPCPPYQRGKFLPP